MNLVEYDCGGILIWISESGNRRKIDRMYDAIYAYVYILPRFISSRTGKFQEGGLIGRPL